MAQGMGSVSGWYTNAYSGPFRTSRLRAPSLLPTHIPPTIQQTLVIETAQHARPPPNADGSAENGNKVKSNRRETVFGPDVGEDDEPGWGQTGKEEIGIEKVREWVEKAKGEEGIHPTTTLQAAVNLKRPTLLLQQVSDQQLHTLQFSYDASAPAVQIRLLLYPPPVALNSGKDSVHSHDTQSNLPHDSQEDMAKVLYDGTHSGGFGKLFQLPSESGIDLSSAVVVTKIEEAVDKKDNVAEEGEEVQESSPEETRAAEEAMSGRRRFGLFGRSREESSASQIEMTRTHAGAGTPTTNTNASAEVRDHEEKKEEQGLRLVIQLDAIGPQGQPMKRKNAQSTHVLITGTWVPDPTPPSESTYPVTTSTSQGAAEGETGKGKRVWVIKVVRREAMIGTHTFLLKEIYGLSSSSQSTTYPPPPSGGASDYPNPYGDGGASNGNNASNECIICLSSPRDVVLLPCRHLVVCRDCAVGMVEFGAGGKVGRREDVSSVGAAATVDGSGRDGATGADGLGTGAAGPTVTEGTTTSGREREHRKKKVKGWYCPVCRQPYTSLLRLALPSTPSPCPSPAPSRTHSRSPSRQCSRPASRAASIRTTRTTKSLAPTLPDGAEKILDALRPTSATDDEDDEDANGISDRAQQNQSKQVPPSFVDDKDIDGEKDPVEHCENASSHSADASSPARGMAPDRAAEAGRGGY